MSEAFFSNSCPECNNNLIEDANKGECFCPSCGYVVMDQIENFGPEAISSNLEERMKNSRSGSPMSYSMHDLGLRTEIAYTFKDFNGRAIDSAVAEQMQNVRRWHSRIRVASPKERRLSNVLSRINETCSALNLPKLITETASMIYRNYENQNVAKGKSVACMASAAIYLACKRCDVVRSLEEIVRATGAPNVDNSNLKLASKYYRMLVMDSGDSVSKAPALSIDRYIAKLANMAKIDTKVEKLAIDIAHKTEDHALADGKAPNGLAAAYIYIASLFLGVNVLQRDISSLSNVTEVTIRNRCKDILTNFRMRITLKAAGGTTTTATTLTA
ncbi:MAG: transcription initiation factor IIB family protein [Nitrososphaerales archaeon]